MHVVRAAALERDRRVHVLSSAPGLPRQFDFPIHRWRIEGALRQTEIARRVEWELRRRGVRADWFLVRVAVA